MLFQCKNGFVENPTFKLSAPSIGVSWKGGPVFIASMTAKRHTKWLKLFAEGKCHYIGKLGDYHTFEFIVYSPVLLDHVIDPQLVRVNDVDISDEYLFCSGTFSRPCHLLTLAKAQNSQDFKIKYLNSMGEVCRQSESTRVSYKRLRPK